ncbi:MAG: hypothetical protein ABIE23_04475, partial [archaeon]
KTKGGNKEVKYKQLTSIDSVDVAELTARRMDDCTGEFIKKEMDIPKTPTEQKNAKCDAGEIPSGISGSVVNPNCFEKHSESYAEIIETYAKANRLSAIEALAVLQQESSCGVLAPNNPMQASGCSNVTCSFQRGFKVLREAYDMADYYRLIGEDKQVLALYGYNRGTGNEERAITLMTEGHSRTDSMVMACEEWYAPSKCMEGQTSLPIDKCCNSPGYGAQYPER